MTHSSAAIATSCRCTQATSHHRSRSYEPTYSHQFGHHQMIDLMQNVGEFEGTAIANELTHTCTPARMRPMDCSPTCARPSQHSQTPAMLSIMLSKYWVIFLSYRNKAIYFIKTLVLFTVAPALRVSAPTKKRPYPLPPRPRIRGASPKYFPLFRPKEFSYER